MDFGPRLGPRIGFVASLSRDVLGWAAWRSRHDSLALLDHPLLSLVLLASLVLLLGSLIGHAGFVPALALVVLDAPLPLSTGAAGLPIHLRALS